MIKKNLTHSQQLALRLLTERLNTVRFEIQNLILEIFKEHNIPQEEQVLWRISDDYTHIYKVEEMTEPKELENDSN